MFSSTFFSPLNALAANDPESLISRPGKKKIPYFHSASVGGRWINNRFERVFTVLLRLSPPKPSEIPDDLLGFGS